MYIEPQSDVIATVSNFIEPILLVFVIGLFFLASTATQSKDPKQVFSAWLQVVMKAAGALLMMFAVFMTIIALLDSLSYGTELFVGLVLSFSVGGILFLWSDQRLREMADEFTKVPSAMYNVLFTAIGYLLVTSSGLLFSTLVASNATSEPYWWYFPVIILLFGILICAMTSNITSPTPVKQVAKTTKKTTSTVKKTVRRKTRKAKK